MNIWSWSIIFCHPINVPCVVLETLMLFIVDHLIHKCFVITHTKSGAATAAAVIPQLNCYNTKQLFLFTVNSPFVILCFAFIIHIQFQEPSEKMSKMSRKS